MSTAAVELRDDIKRAAAMKNLDSQKEMAEALGITAQYLSDIFRNRKRLTPQLVSKAATAFDIHPVRLRRWHRLGAIESGWQIDTRMAE